MAERFKAPVLKTDVGVSSPRVRISLPPPTGPQAGRRIPPRGFLSPPRTQVPHATH